jgi:hypothetical protein
MGHHSDLAMPDGLPPAAVTELSPDRFPPRPSHSAGPDSGVQATVSGLLSLNSSGSGMQRRPQLPGALPPLAHRGGMLPSPSHVPDAPMPAVPDLSLVRSLVDESTGLELSPDRGASFWTPFREQPTQLTPQLAVGATATDPIRAHWTSDPVSSVARRFPVAPVSADAMRSGKLPSTQQHIVADMDVAMLPGAGIGRPSHHEGSNSPELFTDDNANHHHSSASRDMDVVGTTPSASPLRPSSSHHSTRLATRSISLEQQRLRQHSPDQDEDMTSTPYPRGAGLVDPIVASQWTRTVDGYGLAAGHGLRPVAVANTFPTPAESTRGSRERSPAPHVTTRQHQATTAAQSVVCQCKKSRCIKLYCDCFKDKLECGTACGCVDCLNTKEHQDLRLQAIHAVESRRPDAFGSRIDEKNSSHRVGCKCSRTACLKKYCECFKSGVTCAGTCSCTGCKNFEGSVDRAEAMGSTGRQGRRRPAEPRPHSPQRPSPQTPTGSETPPGASPVQETPPTREAVRPVPREPTGAIVLQEEGSSPPTLRRPKRGRSSEPAQPAKRANDHNNE